MQAVSREMVGSSWTPSALPTFTMAGPGEGSGYQHPGAMQLVSWVVEVPSL